MDSAIAHWRALTTARYWLTVAALTFAWCAGVGLALQAFNPPQQEHGLCGLGPFHSPVASMQDVMWLPWRAFVASAYGLYEWGLLFFVVAAAVVLFPCALLEQGSVKRVVSTSVVLVAAGLVALAGWLFEMQHVVAAGVLPALVCSN